MILIALQLFNNSTLQVSIELKALCKPFQTTYKMASLLSNEKSYLFIKGSLFLRKYFQGDMSVK